ncbi:uncharacterized protein MYCFIDRAFT_209405 [Pseudocercospora fijiensis CIRAD86]|uniref:Uncharacterized protein n=1 Tax=Pseudocercospora fijiensis (strain CIRAD86) TaxID=383855 RepID=M3AHG4_PSEFD|nr:uncharacterized protein MYCFIDRAFT_209405 [Pseudocercospora fijiensis CIRAD86]EME76947.1 hypothetical protein MYCFIDRAFT_209405 [Pseudocercospora fijiensis CIRAD86]
MRTGVSIGDRKLALPPFPYCLRTDDHHLDASPHEGLDICMHVQSSTQFRALSKGETVQPPHSRRHSRLLRRKDPIEEDVPEVNTVYAGWTPDASLTNEGVSVKTSQRMKHSAKLRLTSSITPSSQHSPHLKISGPEYYYSRESGGPYGNVYAALTLSSTTKTLVNHVRLSMFRISAQDQLRGHSSTILILSPQIDRTAPPLQPCNNNDRCDLKHVSSHFSLQIVPMQKVHHHTGFITGTEHHAIDTTALDYGCQPQAAAVEVTPDLMRSGVWTIPSLKHPFPSKSPRQYQPRCLTRSMQICRLRALCCDFTAKKWASSRKIDVISHWRSTSMFESLGFSVVFRQLQEQVCEELVKEKKESWERLAEIEQEMRLMYSTFLDDQARWPYTSIWDSTEKDESVVETANLQYRNTCVGTTVRKPLSKSTSPITNSAPKSTTPSPSSPSHPGEKPSIQTHRTPQPRITTSLLLISPLSQTNQQKKNPARIPPPLYPSTATPPKSKPKRKSTAGCKYEFPIELLCGRERVRVFFSPPVKWTRILKAKGKGPEGFEGDLKGVVERDGMVCCSGDYGVSGSVAGAGAEGMFLDARARCTHDVQYRYYNETRNENQGPRTLTSITMSRHMHWTLRHAMPCYAYASI